MTSFSSPDYRICIKTHQAPLGEAFSCHVFRKGRSYPIKAMCMLKCITSSDEEGVITGWLWKHSTRSVIPLNEPVEIEFRERDDSSQLQIVSVYTHKDDGVACRMKAMLLEKLV